MPRSNRYQQAIKLIDKEKIYSIDEALELLPKTATTKFEPSVELHTRLGINISKSDQQVRGTVVLPYGSGKTAKIAVFVEDTHKKEAQDADADIIGGEELIDEIRTSGKINFDVAVATPAMMKHMAKIAKVLGPKGLMPSPKNDTVTNDIADAISQLKKGKVTFKNDSSGNIHLIIGKNNFPAEHIKANIETALDAIKKAKPSSSKGTYLKTISLNATMGPSIKITTT